MARRRARAFERLEDVGMPTESEEIWRYSGIDAFDIGRFAPPLLAERTSGPGQAPDTQELASELALAERLADALGPRSALVVSVDGLVMSIDMSSNGEGDGEDEDGKDGLEVESARGLTTAHGQPPVLGELGRTNDAFGELHDSFLADAVLVSVGHKSVLSKPVVIVHVARAGEARAKKGEGSSCFPHTVIRTGRSAQVGVIELFVSTDTEWGEVKGGHGADAVAGLGTGGPREEVTAHAQGVEERKAGSEGGAGVEGAVLVVPVTELDVGEDAHLDYANFQVLGPSCTQIALQASRVQNDGVLRSFTASLGASRARVRTDSDVVGQGAQSTLLAAYLGTGDQVHDFRTLQDHHGRRTRSELLFKGAVMDRAHSVYSGLIRIERGAHGADAFQTNHNLVLSEGAHADSVPNLDIDENDVRCSHASTVGPIDDEQLYYLESRGVEPAVAERLIVLGFFTELAERAPLEGVGRLLEDWVSARLAGRTLAEGSLSSPGDERDG
jgi:Fe-S cluster assembly protein SufD